MIDVGIASGRIVRTGIVTGIPVDGLPDQFILAKALAADGMPAFQSAWASGSTYLLSQVRVMPAAGDIARVELIYQPPDWGQTAYLIRDSTVLTEIVTQYVPGNDKSPFRVSYTPPSGSGAGSSNVLADTLSLAITVPTRSIDITMIGSGSPASTLRPYVGYVNSDTFLTYNAGYWQFTRFESDINKYQGTFIVSSSMMTKGFEDWSVWGTLQDKTTGRYVDTSSVITTAKSRAYSYGVIYGANNSGSGGGTDESTNGLIRVGPYQATAFMSLFPNLDTTSTGLNGDPIPLPQPIN